MVVRRTFWGVLTLLVVSAAAAYFTPLVSGTPTPVFFTRLVYLSALLIVFSWVWAYFSTRGFLLQRDARILRQQVGDVFEERFRVSNRFPYLRLWVEVRDDSSLPGNSGSRILSLINARQQRSYIAYTQLDRRGAFELGPTSLVSGDPFGLFLNIWPMTTRAELVVLPMIVNLKSFPAPAGMFPGGRAIRRRATEITPQAAGVREYAPGDALRRIHWPTSARRDRLMTKEFEEDPQADVWVFLDAYAPTHFHFDAGDQPSVKRVDQLWLWKRQTQVKLPADSFEYAVSAAGSIAQYYLTLGRTVGFVCASDAFTVLSPERGERQINKILETLTFLSSTGTLPLLALIEAQAPSLPRASTVVIVTASRDPSVDVALDYLIMRNLRPVIVWLDAPSFGAPSGGEDIVYRLQQRGIPVMILRKDQDLADALEKPIIA